MASQESNVSTITTRTCLDPMEKNTKNYNSSSREGSTSSLAAVLLAGRDLAKQLQLLDHHHHHHPIPSRHSSLSVDHEEDKSGEQQSTCRQGVTQKILESYDNALSLLSHYRLEEVVATTPSRIEDGADGGDLSLHSQSPGFKIPPPLIRGAYKRRVLPKQTRQVEVTVSPGTTLDDGFSWRKYGQKEILGLKHPRCYYRCTHRHAQGCLATKQVQREDGNLFQVTYIGSHTCLSGHGKQEASVVTWSPSPASSMTTCREGSPLFFDTWSPPPASSVMTCGEGSPLFFDDSEFGEVEEEEEEEEAAHAPVLRPQSRTKSQLCDLLQKQTASRVPAFPSSYSSASRFEEIRPELEEFSEVRLIDLDAYDLYGDSEENDGTMLTSHEATNLNLDLGLGMSSNKSTNLKGSLRIRASLDLGNGMSSAPNSGMTATDLDLRLGMMMSSGMPTNFRGSLGSGPNLDLGIGMSIVSGSGVVQSLQSQVVSCFQLQDVNKKVSDGLLGMAEPIQMEVKDNATLSECTSHCNSIMNTGKQLYISKSPSQKTICAHNFVSLFFPYCNLPQLWKGGEQLLLSLKRFDANHSNLLWIPNLSKAQKLESLNLEGCTNLVGISSIQYLIKLQHLNLKGCRSLKGIPSLIRLKQLKTFDLSDCSNLIRLPPSLGCLPNLSELNLKNCAKLANLPRSVIHLMKSLETLNISGCSSMWKTIGEDEDGTVPLPTKPHFGVSIMPSSGATHQETLPNSNSEIPAEQVDAVAEGSPLQDLSLDLKDIRGKKAIELEEEACTGTPLIISLLSELGAAILFPPDVGSSHASSSSSQDINIQALNHTENNKSAAEESKVAAVLQREDHQQQQLCNDHDNAKTDQKELPSAGDEQKFCQVEDCQVNLTGAEAYYQQHKICEVHCMATAALLGNILQRFCQQCCRFHVLSDFNEEERNCRSRVAGYHQKQRRQSSTTTTSTKEEHPSPETDSDAEINIAEPEDENGKCSLHKRIRTIEAPEQNQPTQDAEQQSSCSSFNDWDEANAIGDIEERVLEMIEQISRSNYIGDEEKAAAAVPESVVAWLAEMEESIPETVRSMKSAKAKAAADSEEWKAVDARLVVGELELRLLDLELTRISKEEEEIEAELQRLMEKKSELSQQH